MTTKLEKMVTELEADLAEEGIELPSVLAGTTTEIQKLQARIARQRIQLRKMHREVELRVKEVQELRAHALLVVRAHAAEKELEAPLRELAAALGRRT